MGLVLHQHLHALHICAPELQAVLHPLDLQANKDQRGFRTCGITGQGESTMNLRAGLGLMGSPSQLLSQGV